MAWINRETDMISAKSVNLFRLRREQCSISLKVKPNFPYRNYESFFPFLSVGTVLRMAF